MNASSLVLVGPLLAALAGCAAHSAATSPSTARALPATARALPADLDLLTGPAWHGTLTYLDYQSRKPVSIRSTLLVTRLPGSARRWEERLGYDDEPHANRAEVVTLSDDGRVLDGQEVVAREALPDGGVRVVTEAEGEDDNRPARFRHVYLLGARESSLQKLVRFAGTLEFFERNRYAWKR